MRNTRLFIGFNPDVKNTDFNWILDTSNNYVVDGWTFPSPNTFTANAAGYPVSGEHFEPYSDNTYGNYAIRQDIGLKGEGVVRLNFGVYEYGTPTGKFRVQIGDAYVDFVPNTTPSGSNVFDIQTGQNYGEWYVSFSVSNINAVFGYDLAVRGGGSDPNIGGTMPVDFGLRYVKIISYDTFWNELDLYDNVDIPVTYNVADVRDISKKDSNFSLTVTLPNTDNNAQLFNCIHEISSSGSIFEMLKQYPAYVEVENNRTFDGYLKLNKVVINDNREISYEINLYSSFIEFVKRLGTTTLRGNDDSLDDLSFSEYTTPITEDTWFQLTDMFEWANGYSNSPTGEKPYGKGFYLAPVDKMKLSERAYKGLIAKPDSNPHNNDIVPLSIPIFFDELTPFLFIKEIWDKIFEWAGFSYVSDFIEDNSGNTTSFHFDHLVYPAVRNYKTGVVMDEEYAILQDNTTNPIVCVDYGNNWVSSQFLTVQKNIFTNMYSNLGLEETIAGSVQLNPTLITFTNSGIYHLNVNVPFEWKWQLTKEYDTSTYTFENWTVSCNMGDGYQMKVAVKLHTSNGDETIAEFDTGWCEYESGGYEAVGGMIKPLGDGDQNLNFDGDIYVQAGDYIFLEYYYNIREEDGFGIGQFVIDPGYLPPADNHARFVKGYITIKNHDVGADFIRAKKISDFYLGSNFDPTVVLNKDRKKFDFINDIIKKFNLYVEDVTNKKDDNGVYYRDYPNVRRGEYILRIEPRDIFYNNLLTTRNWTDRTDISSVSFNRLDEYIYKRVELNDKNDETFWVKDYNDYDFSLGEYGEMIATGQMNTNADEKTEITTSFGQTMVGAPTTNYDFTVTTPRTKRYSGYNSYFQCPSVFSLDNSGKLKSDKEFNDRMFFVHNLYPDGTVAGVYDYDFSNEYTNSGILGWRIFLRDNSDPETPNTNTGYYLNTAIKTYLYLDHLNVPFGKETADLNFGKCVWYWQNLNGWPITHNNTYNTFYRQMLDEYNSPDARLMKCKMFLKPSDIRDVKLSDVIIVNSVPYHINKISQWKNGQNAVDVELVKILHNNQNVNVTPGPHSKSIQRTPSPIVTPVSVKNQLETEVKNIDGKIENQNKIFEKQNLQISELEKTVEELKTDSNTAGKNVMEELKGVSEQLSELDKTVSSNSQATSSAIQDVQNVQKTVEDLIKRIEDLELRMGYKDGR